MGDQREVPGGAEDVHLRGQEQEDLCAVRRVVGQAPADRHRGGQHIQPGP